MPGDPVLDTHIDGHGDVFARDLGAMIVHVQRETGLAHRTFVFRPWQVRFARAVTSRWVWPIAVMAIASWVFFATQAIRVPLLNTQISRMEKDALRLDTLQQTLMELQARYEQVQSMLSQPAQPRASSAGRAPDQQP